MFILWLVMFHWTKVAVTTVDSSRVPNQKLVACATEQLGKSPSPLTLVSKTEADVVLVLADATKMTPHTVGQLRRPDGALVAEVDVKSGSTGYCHRVSNVFDELAKKLEYVKAAVP